VSEALHARPTELSWAPPTPLVTGRRSFREANIASFQSTVPSMQER
jgi:hypothetical protein